MSGNRPLAVALVHHPVLDRRRDEVTSAVTNLDIHDIARSARTFGIARYYVVTPVEEQLRLVERILEHWRSGFGASYNGDRSEALGLVRTAASIEEALSDWGAELEEEPLPVLTGAGRKAGISFGACRDLNRNHPLMLVLGTGWGLTPAFFSRGWAVLESISGASDYNHLPVRAAAAIMFDRLRGDRD